MRNIISLVSLIVAMVYGLNAANVEVGGNSENGEPGANFNPEALCQQLKEEFGDHFFLDSNPESGKYKLKSETGNRIVWVFHPPQVAFQAAGVKVMKSRFDNLGQENSVYHLQVNGKAYKLHLSESASCVKAPKDAPGEDIELIKAWVATFRGQQISTSMSIRTE